MSTPSTETSPPQEPAPTAEPSKSCSLAEQESDIELCRSVLRKLRNGKRHSSLYISPRPVTLVALEDGEMDLMGVSCGEDLYKCLDGKNGEVAEILDALAEKGPNKAVIVQGAKFMFLTSDDADVAFATRSLE